MFQSFNLNHGCSYSLSILLQNLRLKFFVIRHKFLSSISGCLCWSHTIINTPLITDFLKLQRIQKSQATISHTNISLPFQSTWKDWNKTFSYSWTPTTRLFQICLVDFVLEVAYEHISQSEWMFLICTVMVRNRLLTSDLHLLPD